LAAPRDSGESSRRPGWKARPRDRPSNAGQDAPLCSGWTAHPAKPIRTDRRDCFEAACQAEFLDGGNTSDDAGGLLKKGLATDEPSAAHGRKQTTQIPECLAVFPLRSWRLRERFAFFRPINGPSFHAALRRFGPFHVSRSGAKIAKEDLSLRRSPIVRNPQTRLIFPENRRGVRRFCTLAVPIKTKQSSASICVHPWLTMSFFPS